MKLKITRNFKKSDKSVRLESRSIFALFERMRMVEQKGSGISSMRDLMKEEGLTPPEFNIDGIFTVTFRRPFDFKKWVDKWVEKPFRRNCIPCPFLLSVRAKLHYVPITFSKN